MLADYIQTSNNFSNFLHQYVEVKTYLSIRPLYGEIIEVTPLSVVLCSKYVDKSSYAFDEVSTLYLPIGSIISIIAL